MRHAIVRGASTFCAVGQAAVPLKDRFGYEASDFLNFQGIDGNRNGRRPHALGRGDWKFCKDAQLYSNDSKPQRGGKCKKRQRSRQKRQSRRQSHQSLREECRHSLAWQTLLMMDRNARVGARRSSGQTEGRVFSKTNFPESIDRQSVSSCALIGGNNETETASTESRSKEDSSVCSPIISWVLRCLETGKTDSDGLQHTRSLLAQLDPDYAKKPDDKEMFRNDVAGLFCLLPGPPADRFEKPEKSWERGHRLTIISAMLIRSAVDYSYKLVRDAVSIGLPDVEIPKIGDTEAPFSALEVSGVNTSQPDGELLKSQSTSSLPVENLQDQTARRRASQPSSTGSPAEPSLVEVSSSTPKYDDLQKLLSNYQLIFDEIVGLLKGQSGSAEKPVDYKHLTQLRNSMEKITAISFDSCHLLRRGFEWMEKDRRSKLLEAQNCLFKLSSSCFFHIWYCAEHSVALRRLYKKIPWTISQIFAVSMFGLSAYHEVGDVVFTGNNGLDKSFLNLYAKASGKVMDQLSKLSPKFCQLIRFSQFQRNFKNLCDAASEVPELADRLGELPKLKDQLPELCYYLGNTIQHRSPCEFEKDEARRLKTLFEGLEAVLRCGSWGSPKVTASIGKKASAFEYSFRKLMNMVQPTVSSWAGEDPGAGTDPEV